MFAHTAEREIKIEVECRIQLILYGVRNKNDKFKMNSLM
jgi:hypothetical protein